MMMLLPKLQCSIIIFSIRRVMAKVLLDSLKLIQPVSVTICKTVYLTNVANHPIYEHCKQHRAKVGVT